MTTWSKYQSRVREAHDCLQSALDDMVKEKIYRASALIGNIVVALDQLKKAENEINHWGRKET